MAVRRSYTSPVTIRYELLVDHPPGNDHWAGYLCWTTPFGQNVSVPLEDFIQSKLGT